MNGPLTVAVIGGGAAGTLAAIHLAAHPARTPRRVVVIDPASRLGMGAAYGTRSLSHLLNVRASGMSAFPDDPGHFLAWAQDAGIAAGGADFLPRRHYGPYLRDTLGTALGDAAITRLTHRRTVVRRLRTAVGGWVVELTDGDALAADHVILATGARAAPFAAPAHPGYVPDPWLPGAVATLRDRERVLIVGSGLSAVDVVLSLRDAGHRGTVRMVSRHGLLPEQHVDTPLTGEPPVLTPDAAVAGSVRRAMRSMRVAAATSSDWRSILDGLRPVTVALWRGLPDHERRRFGRHVARYWEVRRHRMAPEVADVIARLREEGRVQVDRGRVVRVVADHDRLRVTIRTSAGDEEASMDALVLCVGPSADPHHDPFLRGLVDDGLASAHRSGMGLDVDWSGRVVSRDGAVTSTLWTMGVLRKGAEWESTAVPELRVQARDIATAIAGASPASSP